MTLVAYGLIQHHTPEEQNPNDFTVTLRYLNMHYFYVQYYIFLPTDDKNNSE